MSLLLEPQKGEMCEGMFEWQLERFLENDKERKSSVFKFGRHNGFLRLLDKSTKCFVETDQSKPRWSNFEIKLDIIKLLGLNIFRKPTYYKTCFLTCDGSEFFIKDGYIHGEETSFHMMLCCEGLMDEKKTELLPDGTLTIRLMWYDRKSKLGCLKEEQSTQTTPDLIPEEGPTKFLLTLSKHLECLYNNKVDSDCVLKVNNVQIPVHRSVLSARSKVLATMLRHDTSENYSGAVVITDTDVTVMSDILFYLYSGQIRGLSSDTVALMYVAADKYDVIELRDACVDILNHSLTIENVCEAALLAHTHGEVKLEKKIANFIGDKLKDVEHTDGWKQLLHNKPSLAIKLLHSAWMTNKEIIKQLSSK